MTSAAELFLGTGDNDEGWRRSAWFFISLLAQRPRVGGTQGVKYKVITVASITSRRTSGVFSRALRSRAHWRRSLADHRAEQCPGCVEAALHDRFGCPISVLRSRSAGRDAALGWATIYHASDKAKVDVVAHPAVCGVVAARRHRWPIHRHQEQEL